MTKTVIAHASVLAQLGVIDQSNTPVEGIESPHSARMDWHSLNAASEQK